MEVNEHQRSKEMWQSHDTNNNVGVCLKLTMLLKFEM